MNRLLQASQLLQDQRFLGLISVEELQSLRGSSEGRYLDAIANLGLNPALTQVVFVYHEDIFVEICSRWMSISRSSGGPFLVLGALARLLPLAPQLSVFVRKVVDQQRAEISQAFSLRRVAGLRGDPDDSIHHDLLTIFRIQLFDNEAYSALVAPAQMQVILGQSHGPSRYLAIRILCLYLHASDRALAKMINEYIGVDTQIEGAWEDTVIDYVFLDLWEARRLNDLHRMLQGNRASQKTKPGYPKAINIIKDQDLSPTTARVGDTLIPRFESIAKKLSPIVLPETSKRNLDMLAKAYVKSKNILVTGPPGAGKTTLVREIAHDLGQISSMITLHLNEQTDAKLLVGLYTSDNSQGSFSWNPGVLTKAVTEGRWVMVEDLDRAPPEVISTLLPLLERRELLMPNWGECIPAAPGFRLFATIRSVLNGKGDLVIPNSNITGLRHWTAVPMLMPPDHELADIATQCYPALKSHMSKVMSVYSSLRNFEYHKLAGKSSNFDLSRSYGPHDLFRWCRRIDALLRAAGVQTGYEPISETTNDNIFLEAVDCFAGFLPPNSVKAAVVGSLAKELQFAPDRVTFCLGARKPEYAYTDSHFRFGRASLPRRKIPPGTRTASHILARSPFALNNHALRFLESVGVAVAMSEPCLLVGETGTGKTALVQQLAALMDIKLTVVNLSQQSEAGDLLGGYKPVNLRTIAVPILEEFEDLFNVTFSSKRNQNYIDNVTKAVLRGRWTRALALWHEAHRMAEAALYSNEGTSIGTGTGYSSKKRRVDVPRFQVLKARWGDFGSRLVTFKRHLSRGAKGFAFSFVEGNIVKAAKSGHWVLLDEINLASSDTLESVADLLSPQSIDGPSLLLSETGDAERVRAHEGFRIFGAMNPATDVGKRDLPASFRSRFTEIFIDPPDRTSEDLISIIKVYLGSYTHADVRASSDIAKAYLEIKALSEQNLLDDGSNQKPHFSLRTLTRTLCYTTDIAPVYGLRRALYEGFSMSFLTMLSTKSANIVAPIIEKNILANQRNRLALLSQVPRPPENKRGYIRFKHYWIPQGSCPIEQQPDYIITPFIEHNLLNLVRATMTHRFPILLQGPTSSGKTSMIEYLAKISGNKFVRINNHEHTDLQEYLGAYVSGVGGGLQYREGVLARALREGSWIVLDELNLAPTDVLEALNRLLDDNKELLIPETQQIVRPHADFMLFATQNPPELYGGRKVLSRAFRNRFLELHFDDIPEDELETILREKCKIAPSFGTRIVTVYKRLCVLRQIGRLFEKRNSFATLRDLFRWALRDADDREQLARNGFLLLAERVRDSNERKAVKEIIEDVMKVPLNESFIYDNERILPEDGSNRQLDSKIVWTRSMRRLYVLVKEAFKNNEPVLLVGETGSGKTTICQVFAEHMRTALHTVNAHQNLETGDLIGAYRPIRKRDVIDSQLVGKLARALDVPVDSSDAPGNNLPALLEVYDGLSDLEKNELPQELHLFVESSRLRSIALFEWVDGSLVKAMKTGEHFLLDEISLADDSVLERLNSVLEPGRTLFLAEKGTDDAPLTASRGFQFCATMNPGGDYGKKELSPALRNRFTEIWVPSLDNNAELLEIAYDRLAARCSKFAEPIVAFGAWFSCRYNPITPSNSIRDLLTWINFLNASLSENDYSMVLHGAATVYIDSLGADPAAKLSVPAEEVHRERHACLLQLSEIFQYDMVTIYHMEYALSIDGKNFAIGPFKLNISYDGWLDPAYCLEAATAKANAFRVVRALQLQKPVLLEGSPGVGKTTLISTIAAAIGMPLTRINLSDQTDLADLFGSDVPLDGADAGNFGWRQAPFLQSMQKGEWVLLDEMNLAPQSVLEGLNACLDHRGEVYVSELDQTFAKHPSFVLFAAQNPRHQGGGRKGLPSSFVNRFTVVCVDEFTPQDQLTICRRAFPTCPNEVLESITKCIGAVNSLVSQNPAIDIQGGPWEFNLRDAFRWLHLITSHNALLPAGNPAHYQDLLILQRLRTTENVAAASRLMSTVMPRTGRPHNQICLLSTCFLQVGLGLLSKSKELSHTAPQQNFSIHSNLQCLESIMLCVQNNWPCLLVGASGSGKTYTIAQLANAVGAEVLTIHLNADMDTMDLIGGYGQADPQRSIARSLNWLRKSFRETTIKSMLVKSLKSVYLDALEDQLQLKSPDLPKLITILRHYAKEGEAPEYSNVADDLERCTQQAREDNRGRFEWVDGILVRALQEGSWLILDHANLCNPSVLDRLNSLLEPNGSLIINERRSPNGSAPIIKPHSSFRIFMTMDPRHGELSRAMRNRSLELYLPAATYSEANIKIDSVLTSSSSRHQIFERFDWVSLTDAIVIELISIGFDHLAFSDLPLRLRWVEQVHNGLLPLSPNQLPLFSYIASLYERMMETQSALFSSIQNRYQNLTSSLTLDNGRPDYASTQTLHPMNNYALVEISLKDGTRPDLEWLGFIFDLSFTLCKFEHRLRSLEKAAKTRFGRLMPLSEGSLNLSQSEYLANFLSIGALSQVLGTTLRRFSGGSGLKQGDQNMLDLLEKLTSYLDDFADVVEVAELDHGVFQTYKAAGNLLARNLMGFEALEDLAEALLHGLKTFDASFRLSSGQCMETLWSIFDSATAKNPSELAARLQVEALSDRFDRISWSSHRSIGQLDALRNSLLRVAQSISLAPNYAESLQDVRNAFDSFPSDQDVDESDTRSPYFQAEFEGLRQYVNCSNAFDSDVRDTVLELLACRSTKRSMCFGPSSYAYRILTRLEDCTGISRSENALVSVRGTLAMSILRKIHRSSELPLRALDSLGNEIDILANRTALLVDSLNYNHQQTLVDLLSRIYALILSAHESLLDSTSSSASIEQLKHMTKHSLAIKELKSVSLQDSMMDSLDIADFQKIIAKYFNPSLEILHKALQYHEGVKTKEAATSTAIAWIYVFTGCLLLYVPDQPFDPASRRMVEQDRQRKRKLELQNKLEAQVKFELASTGRASNLRCQKLQQKLQALGDEPRTQEVTRPPQTRLAALQAVFNGLLTSTLRKLTSPDSLESLCQGNSTQKSEIELLRSNIARHISRLSDDEFRTYEDITNPLIAMLRGLEVGLALLMYAHGLAKMPQEHHSLDYSSVPFLGMRPDYPYSIGLQPVSSQGLQSRLMYLRTAALVRTVNSASGDRISSLALEIYHGFYMDWKQQLSESQKENATKSSLYKYQKSDEHQEESSADMKEIFTNDENETLQSARGDCTNSDPRMLSRSIAQIHRGMFKGTKTVSQHILGMLKDAATRLGEVPEDMAEAVCSALPIGKLLPALILRLGESREQLRNLSTSGRTYNFYADANLIEVQRLVTLLHNIGRRFSDLKEAWPEHATIGDVLRTSNELLDTRYTEPIAKLMTKTEQLHDYIHEWQVVASRKYSAISLYEQLTSLLVSWRRLELSTWARLLDIEDEKCILDVEAWWFIAYEVIIAAPLSIIESGQELGTHVEKLLDTLAEFLRTTSTGHFTLRMQMIDCFVGHVEMIEREIQPMRLVANALRNFLSFYRRFQLPTHEAIQNGRQVLEKEMREIILMASWKDTNINALRDSAKRSHYKLFKVIRKYRAILAQPVQMIFERDLADIREKEDPSEGFHPETRMLAADPVALQICEKALPGWEAKPARFKGPEATAIKVTQMTEIPESSMDGATFLDTYTSILVDGIKSLQRETPASVTNTKGKVLKHLKARKRRLFIDTVKDIRQMGFKQNMDASALSRQASLSRIFTDTPAISNPVFGVEIQTAEAYFYRLLDFIPRVTASARKHSEDLSHAEVARSISLLESMLHVILKQRDTLATSVTEQERLAETIDALDSLWVAGKSRLRRRSAGDTCRFRMVIERLGWLPGLLETGCTLLEKHGSLGDIDDTKVIQGLTVWKQNTCNILNTHRSLANLPEGLSSSLHDQIYRQAEDTLQRLGDDLNTWKSECPKTEFILNQIEPWTDVTFGSVSQANGNATLELAALDKQITQNLDALLISVQGVKTATADIPVSTKDAAWLIQSDKSFSKVLKCFRLAAVAQSFDQIMSSLQYIPIVDGGELKAAAASMAMTLPILRQCCTSQQQVLRQYAHLHRALCKLAFVLAQSLADLVSRGFCNPPDSASSDAGKTGKLEEGTGLGEGEGAEDISKDIRDEQDLSELAQDKTRNQDGDGPENEEDAVDMDNDELEGELGDAPGSEGEERASGDENGNDEIDEEVGSVDDLDAGAVDEKLWDGGEKQLENKRETSKGTGRTQNYEQAASKSENGDREPDEGMADEEENQNESEIGEAEDVVNGKAEKLDPQRQDKGPLDLLEEIDIDLDNQSTWSGLRESEVGTDLESDGEQSGKGLDAPDHSEDRDNSEIEDVPDLQRPSKTSDREDDHAAGISDTSSPVDTEPENDSPDQDAGLLRNLLDDAVTDFDHQASSEAPAGAQNLDQNDDNEPPGEAGVEGNKGGKLNRSNEVDKGTATREGVLGQSERRMEESLGDDPAVNESTGNDPFQRLGDALERWHRQQQQIRNASSENAQQKAIENEETDHMFEHLKDEDAEADTQALGAATEEQAHALDQRAMDTEMRESYDEFLPDDLNPETLGDKEDREDPMAPEALSAGGDEQPRPGAFIGIYQTQEAQMQDLDIRDSLEEDEQMLQVDETPSTAYPPPSPTVSARSPVDARRLWSHFENLVQPLSLTLTEQLRLILTPTQATKMRGDFRTGKRLNIKRIIPYIASNYKRDKIWMRRSVPQKRNYQIMLAVDDSRSMGESGSGQLAFEALVLVSKSLSMLEVGEICVVGFGDDVKVVHAFDEPFSSAAGINILQQLGFQQTRTNVRKLVAESITLFREAKAKAPSSSSSSTELWQLLLIMSDGLCEDHDEIRRLVRQAQEERIMIVFVIVDGVKGESIVNMSQAVFEDDESGSGGQKLKIKRYLEGFPFMYYLVVGNVQELPGVLATALRQWFSEVLGQGA